jgi:hypothetical protein
VKQSVKMKQKSARTTISRAELHSIHRWLTYDRVHAHVGFRGSASGTTTARRSANSKMVPFWRWAPGGQPM